jgi:ribonuclease-3
MQYRPKADLEKVLGIKILNYELYKQACTHKSALRELKCDLSYERLEFLGDSVVNFVVTRYLFERYPTSAEGFLTRIRTKLVSGASLAIMSEALQLPSFALMNSRALQQNWQNNDRIMEDLFESIVGAMYLDKGLPTCRLFLTKILESEIDWDEIIVDTNHKDMLMRICQFKGWPMPVYVIVDTCGPEHNKTYVVEVYINDTFRGKGENYNKRRAEQTAAKEAITNLNVKVPKSNSTEPG